MWTYYTGDNSHQVSTSTTDVKNSVTFLYTSQVKKLFCITLLDISSFCLVKFGWIVWIGFRFFLQFHFSLEKEIFTKAAITSKSSHTIWPQRSHAIWPQRSKLSRTTSSHRRCSVRKAFLRNFAKFTGKLLCQSLFFNKVSGLLKRFWHRCFLVNFAKLLRTSLLQSTSGPLLL